MVWRLRASRPVTDCWRGSMAPSTVGPAESDADTSRRTSTSHALTWDTTPAAEPRHGPQPTARPRPRPRGRVPSAPAAHSAHDPRTLDTSRGSPLSTTPQASRPTSPVAALRGDSQPVAPPPTQHQTPWRPPTSAARTAGRGSVRPSEGGSGWLVMGWPDAGDEHAMCVLDEHPAEPDLLETVAPCTPAPFAPHRW